MPNGKRWSQPASGTVFVSVTGEVVHVDRGTIGVAFPEVDEADRFVDTGRVWNTADGDD
jgi:hypothetical protein